jgi:multiple sugar transport system substrate-binding protein
MKKKLALALVFVMGLSFTACGKTTVSDSTNEAVSGGVQSTDTNEDKESSGKSDKTTITFINGFTGGDGEYMTKIVDGFNESQSDYYIEQLQDADHYTKFKSGDFDMLIIHADWISTYHAMGLLREVSDIYDMAGIFTILRRHTQSMMTEFLHFHWIYMQKQHFIIKNTQMKHRKIIMI